MKSYEERSKKIIQVTRVGIYWNLMLTIAKFAAGYWGRSYALIADAIHSLTDFISDFAVLIGIKVASKPSDENHHYGHGKFETLATIAITFTLFFAGMNMLWQGSKDIYGNFFGSIPPSPKVFTIVIVIASIIVKEALYRYTLQKGTLYNSKAVITNAWHHRTDAFSSVAVLIGISGAIFLGKSWRVLDPIAAAVISLYILKFAFDTFKDAIDELLEASLDESINEEILQTVSAVNGVYNPHNMRTRKIGNHYAINLHIKVDPDLNIVKAHDIATEVETTLREKYGEEAFLSIHIEPCKPENINPSQSK